MILEGSILLESEDVPLMRSGVGGICAELFPGRPELPHAVVTILADTCRVLIPNRNDVIDCPAPAQWGLRRALGRIGHDVNQAHTAIDV